MHVSFLRFYIIKTMYPIWLFRFFFSASSSFTFPFQSVLWFVVSRLFVFFFGFASFPASCLLTWCCAQFMFVFVLWLIYIAHIVYIIETPILMCSSHKLQAHIFAFCTQENVIFLLDLCLKFSLSLYLFRDCSKNRLAVCEMYAGISKR